MSTDVNRERAYIYCRWYFHLFTNFVWMCRIYWTLWTWVKCYKLCCKKCYKVCYKLLTLNKVWPTCRSLRSVSTRTTNPRRILPHLKCKIYFALYWVTLLMYSIYDLRFLSDWLNLNPVFNVIQLAITNDHDILHTFIINPRINMKPVQSILPCMCTNRSCDNGILHSLSIWYKLLWPWKIPIICSPLSCYYTCFEFF